MESYFTFPDGGLKYDCPSCGQHCCRGKSFAFGPSELVPLLKRAPAIAPQLYLRGGGSFGAVDLTDGCWFLASDGNCALEVEHGRAAKPSTCRLFPFNRIFRVGDVRVVDMNSVLCPLSSAAGDGVRWSELTREIDELVAAGGSPLIDVAATTPLELPADWLATERAIMLAGAVADSPELASLAAAWGRLYGLSPAEQSSLEAQVAPTLALLTPSLRYNALFRKEGGLYPQLAAMLPRRLRALGFLAALAARAGRRSPSLRGMTELWQMQSATLDVLTNWREPVHLLRPNFDADVPAALQAALGVLLAGAFRGGKSLGELVEAAAATLEPAARPLSVALAASQMQTLFSYGV